MLKALSVLQKETGVTSDTGSSGVGGTISDNDGANTLVILKNKTKITDNANVLVGKVGITTSNILD